MDPLNAIGNFVVGLIKAGQIQAWYRLIASIILSSLITFFSTLGASIWLLYSQYGAVAALILSFANACIAVSVIILALVKRSPLTKGIAILVPTKVEAQTADLLTKDGIEYIPNDKR